MRWRLESIQPTDCMPWWAIVMHRGWTYAPQHGDHPMFLYNPRQTVAITFFKNTWYFEQWRSA